LQAFEIVVREQASKRLIGILFFRMRGYLRLQGFGD
jgi:hypothetical protein